MCKGCTATAVRRTLQNQISVGRPWGQRGGKRVGCLLLHICSSKCTVAVTRIGFARQLRGTASACSRDKERARVLGSCAQERCTSGPRSEHGHLPIFPSRRALSGHKLGPWGGRGMERLGRDAINTARCGKPARSVRAYSSQTGPRGNSGAPPFKEKRETGAWDQRPPLQGGLGRRLARNRLLARIGCWPVGEHAPTPKLLWPPPRKDAHPIHVHVLSPTPKLPTLRPDATSPPYVGRPLHALACCAAVVRAVVWPTWVCLTIH